MNISEIKAQSYLIFCRQKADRKAANITAAQYIETLASQTGTNIALWDILELFGEGRGHNLVKDKNEINKRFFAYLEKCKSEADSELIQLERVLSQRVDAIYEGNKNRRIAGLKQDRDAYLNNAVERLRQASEHVKTAWGITQSIERIERNPDTITPQIMQILRESFWKFHEFNGEELTLTTRNNIILTEINPSAGLRLRVNMGKFRCLIKLQAMNLTVLPYADNVLYENYYHPHVNRNGSICWGNASAAAAKHMSFGEIAPLLRLLSSLLVSYSPEAPYISLYHFQKLRPQDQNPEVVNESSQEVSTEEDNADSDEGAPF
jgi:hypothetical protein